MKNAVFCELEHIDVLGGRSLQAHGFRFVALGQIHLYSALWIHPFPVARDGRAPNHTRNTAMSDKADILLTVGEPPFSGNWPDYPATYGLGADDIPRLIEILCDESLQHADSNSTEVWGALHAWRALGQLHAEAAIEPLIGQLDFLGEDDWAGDELGEVFALIGPAAIEPLEAYLRSPQHDESARAIAVDGLTRIAMHHPEQRERVLTAFRRYMKHPDKGAFELNGILVSDLVDLHATELIDEIRRLFAMKIVDISICDNLEAVEMRLDMRGRRDTPEPDLHDLFRDDEEEDGANDHLRKDTDAGAIHSVPETYVREMPKVGRNDPCPCGSGKKYKRCCLH